MRDDFDVGLRRIDEALSGLIPVLNPSWAATTEVVEEVNAFLKSVTVAKNGQRHAPGKLLETEWRKMAASGNDLKKMSTLQPAMLAYWKEPYLDGHVWDAFNDAMQALMAIALGRHSRKWIREAQEAVEDYLSLRGYQLPREPASWTLEQLLSRVSGKNGPKIVGCLWSAPDHTVERQFLERTVWPAALTPDAYLAALRRLDRTLLDISDGKVWLDYSGKKTVSLIMQPNKLTT